jgi:YidC/Oxa1 family membrane protein insertase
MDRRTLLAFALLTLILVFFSRVSAPPKQPLGHTAAATSAATPGRPGPQADSGSSSAGSGDRAPAAPVASGTQGAGFHNILTPAGGPQVSFHTKLYDTAISPTGARVPRWVLSGYTDAKEQPADLVADAGPGMLRLSVDGPSGSRDFSETEFQATPTEHDGVKGLSLAAQDSSGAKVRIDFEFPEGRHDMGLKVSLDGFASDQGETFLQLAFCSGIAYPEINPKADRNGAAAVALLGKNQYLKHPLGRTSGSWNTRERGVLQWAGTRSKYFLLAAIPQTPLDGEVVLSRDQGQEAIQSALRLPLERSGPTEYHFTVYAGPMVYRNLEAYGAGLERSVDLGWSILLPFTRLLLRFFRAVHQMVPNYGIVILILSVLTKVLFYPLTKKSVESMKQMQLLKPEIDRVSEKFKDDPQRRNQAMMDLYKKHKVNPVGGCLPILIQMPVFIALYSVLNSSIELRKAPFALWIWDLSAPDKVASIAGFPLHILPLVMAATMFWQQKLTPTDPRQAAMAYMMPAIMTVFFYTMPSGLVFYWTVNNLMSIGQQIWMNRTMQHSRLAEIG